MVQPRYDRTKDCPGWGHSVGAFRGGKTVVRLKRREQGPKSVLV